MRSIKDENTTFQNEHGNVIVPSASLTSRGFNVGPNPCKAGVEAGTPVKQVGKRKRACAILRVVLHELLPQFLYVWYSGICPSFLSLV